MLEIKKHKKISDMTFRRKTVKHEPVEKRPAESELEVEEKILTESITLAVKEVPKVVKTKLPKAKSSNKFLNKIKSISFTRLSIKDQTFFVTRL